MIETKEINAAIDQLLKSISERGVSPTERWHLMFFDNDFRCVPVEHGCPAGHILCEFNETQLKSGLTKREYCMIHMQIENILGYPGDE